MFVIFISCGLKLLLLYKITAKIPSEVFTDKYALEVLVLWCISIQLQAEHSSVKLIVAQLANNLQDFSGQKIHKIHHIH